MQQLEELVGRVRACVECAAYLPRGPRPVLSVDERARVLITGQAPGTKVHETGIPWNDASGERLRQWMNLDREAFYDSSRIAIVPMGFCYPGRGRGGDLPPRRECAALWHAPLRALLPNVGIHLLIGRHALRHYLGGRDEDLSTIVRRHRELLAQGFFPLPHPSPRNQGWFKRQPWFEEEVIPALREVLAKIP